MALRDKNKINGFSLIEILIGVAIASIMMAAMFASYTVVNNTYSRVTDVAGISRSGRDIVSMLMRDIRMAGFKYYYGVFENSNNDIPKQDYLEFKLGNTDDTKEDSHMPVVIYKNTLGYDEVVTSETLETKLGKNLNLVDENHADDPIKVCCDRIHVVYGDFNANDLTQPYKRYRVTYFAMPVERKIGQDVVDQYYAVYKSKESWKQTITQEEGEWISNCDECYEGELIREYVVDMEFIALDKNGKTVNANPAENLEEMFNIRSVDVKLTFRSSSPKGYFNKNQKKIVNSFTSDRSDNLEVEDRYLRDNIFVTVHTRNIGGSL